MDKPHPLALMSYRGRHTEATCR